MKSKYIIIDGSSLIHRAFYALPTLTTSSGYFTNAVFGFANMVIKLVGDWKPAGVVVAFDKGKRTFRNDEYAEYKRSANRLLPNCRNNFPPPGKCSMRWGSPCWNWKVSRRTTSSARWRLKAPWTRKC